MKVNKQRRLDAEAPQLRVFWGDAESEAGNNRLPHSDRKLPRQWAQNEAFWAGRNRAGRLSARFAA